IDVVDLEILREERKTTEETDEEQGHPKETVQSVLHVVLSRHQGTGEDNLCLQVCARSMERKGEGRRKKGEGGVTHRRSAASCPTSTATASGVRMRSS